METQWLSYNKYIGFLAEIAILERKTKPKGIKTALKKQILRLSVRLSQSENKTTT